MLWEVEVRPRLRDCARHEAKFYLLNGDLDATQVELIARQLLADSAIEEYQVLQPGAATNRSSINVLLKPGVMDPLAESVRQAIGDLGIAIPQVRTGRRYGCESMDLAAAERLAWTELANDAIEQVIIGPLPESAWAALGAPYIFRLTTVPIRRLDDDALQRLSREGQLYLSLGEMRTIRDHFQKLNRDATDVELETVAQTWSEHCSHKTLKGKIEYTGPNGTVFFENMLKETIFHATQEIRQRLGTDDWCVSVFADNAGIVKFDDENHVCFKVETHNHPSAIEPYGGANTGLGGVIRDVLGTGMGGKPICNTDVFCFAPPDGSTEKLPKGVLHPKRVMRGVVSGVRDYGNRMGIPTVNGAICFDDRYLANPLVYCGTVGLIPVGKEFKQPQPGDLIVGVGGRTGRDGIHGATFSSAELTDESEKVSGGAVQIGNAITEKKVLDVLLVARDRNLYNAITDCGAGGFSSAVGEMGEHIGAEVHLDRAPLKYDGLSYTEIWISEAQERMVLAVSPSQWPQLEALCKSEDVEATVLGEFKPTGRLRLFYQANLVGDLEMKFLHDGRPPVVRKAVWADVRAKADNRGLTPPACQSDFSSDLLKILSSLNVCSKEWVIRQYDHEVQGGTMIKPLTGIKNDGPSDAAVVTPVLGSNRGLAIGCGINPRFGDLDPYHMAASVIDEAVRNVVAVGADPSRIALLDNFCWGNTDRPETLGSLVRAAEACRDVAIAYGTPFISGKDSLNNEFHSGDVHISIPPTLLISAMGILPDVRKCVTMDFKKPGNLIFLLGITKNEMGGSHFNLIHGIAGGRVPVVDCAMGFKVFHRLHDAIQRGLIVSCHDLSEGGMAVALAEMCFAGGFGAKIGNLDGILQSWHDDSPEEECAELRGGYLFSESNSRFLLEIADENFDDAIDFFNGLPCDLLGRVTEQPVLQADFYLGNTWKFGLHATIADLKEAWQRPLRW